MNPVVPMCPDVLRIILEYTMYSELVDAAAYGNLRCMKLICTYGTDWDREVVCQSAAVGGHLACLRYAHKNGLSTGGRSVGQIGVYVRSRLWSS